MSNATFQRIQENQQRLNDCMDEFIDNQCLLAACAAVVEGWLRLSPDTDVDMAPASDYTPYTPEDPVYSPPMVSASDYTPYTPEDPVYSPDTP